MEEITVRVKFNIGEEVWFTPAREPLRGMVLAIVVGTARYPEYVVRWEDMSIVQHSQNELDDEQRII